MAGHAVMAFRLRANRSRDRKKVETEPLVLSAIDRSKTMDLITLIGANLLGVDAWASGDQEVRALHLEAADDRVHVALSVAARGETRSVEDGDDPDRPVVFVHRPNHLDSVLAACTIWRPVDGDSGVVLLHVPWRRNGLPGVKRLLQRAVTKGKGQASIRLDPLVPPKAVEALVGRANGAVIEYTRQERVTSTFDGVTDTTSAPATVKVIVKGASTNPFRDTLSAAIRSGTERQELLTLRMGDGDEQTDEVFDDMRIQIDTPGGPRWYSIVSDSITRLGNDLTSELNPIYSGLPMLDRAQWAKAFLDDAIPHMNHELANVRSML